MILTASFLAAWAVLLYAPDTRIGRSLDRLLVAAPARGLNRISRGQWLVLAVVLVAAGAAVWFGGADGVRVVGMALPDVAVWAASVEITAYLDMLAVALVGWSTVRARRLGTWVDARSPRRVAPRGRERGASHLGSAKRPADNDDGDGRASIALAA